MTKTVGIKYKKSWANKSVEMDVKLNKTAQIIMSNGLSLKW